MGTPWWQHLSTPVWTVVPCHVWQPWVPHVSRMRQLDWTGHFLLASSFGRQVDGFALQSEFWSFREWKLLGRQIGINWLIVAHAGRLRLSGLKSELMKDRYIVLCTVRMSSRKRTKNHKRPNTQKQAKHKNNKINKTQTKHKIFSALFGFAIPMLELVQCHHLFPIDSYWTGPLFTFLLVFFGACVKNVNPSTPRVCPNQRFR